MITNRLFHVSITNTNAVIFTLLGPNTDGVTVFLENQDTVNYVSYQFQSSANNIDANYEDMVDGSGNYGTSGTLAPGARAMVSLHTADAYVRMKASASGGAITDIGITQFSPNGSTNLTTGVQ